MASVARWDIDPETLERTPKRTTPKASDTTAVARLRASIADQKAARLPGRR